MKLIDLTGQRFGRLVVNRRAHALMYGKFVAWECECDCGGTVITVGTSLRRGAVNSCGCLRRNDHEYITYEAAHWRVRQAKGSASEHVCIDCGKQARQWSYNYSDTVEIVCFRRAVLYSTDPSRYEPRCSSCHKLHDNARRASTALKHDEPTK